MKTIFTVAVASALLAGSAFAQDAVSPVSQYELDRQVRELREQRKESYRDLDCNSDYQPVDLYAFCFNSATQKSSPTGAPVGGSDGSQ